jgi:hypothetical protein
MFRVYFQQISLDDVLHKRYPEKIFLPAEQLSQ